MKIVRVAEKYFEFHGSFRHRKTKAGEFTNNQVRSNIYFNTVRDYLALPMHLSIQDRLGVLKIFRQHKMWMVASRKN